MLKKQKIEKRQEELETSGVYQCFICMNRLMKPVKCQNCSKMLCATHLSKIKNKCPYCRNNPFKYQKDQDLESFLNEISREEWETLDKEKVHKCMIFDCQFQGTYVGMLKHRKRNHQKLTIQDLMTGEVVSDEAKKVEMMRNMIRKLIAFKVMELCLTAVQNQLQPDNITEKKKHPNLLQAKKMAEHVAVCTTDQCKKLWNTKWGTYIGKVGDNSDHFHFSNCERGRALNFQLGWKYNDPKH